mgnify:CR=1 FL=1
MRRTTTWLCIILVCASIVSAQESTPSSTEEWKPDEIRKNPEQYFATDPAKALDTLLADPNSIVFISTDTRLNSAILDAYAKNPSLINQDPKHRKFADDFFQLPGNFVGQAAQQYLTQTRGLQISAPPASGEVELIKGPPQKLIYGNNELAMDTLQTGTRIIINEAEKKFLICPPSASADCKGIDVSEVTRKDPEGKLGDLRPTLATSGRFVSLTDKRGKTLASMDESVLSVLPTYGAIDLPDGQVAYGIDRFQFVTKRAGVVNEFSISLGVRDETGAPIRNVEVVNALGSDRILTALGPGQRMAIKSSTGTWKQVTSTAKVADYLNYDFSKQDSDILQTRTFVELDESIRIKGASFRYQATTTAGALIVSSKNPDGTPTHTHLLAYNGDGQWRGPSADDLGKDGYNVVVNRDAIHLARQPVSVLLDGHEGSREFFLQAGTAVIDASTDKGVHTIEANKQRTEIRKVVQVPCKLCRGGYSTREVVQTEFIEAATVTMIDKDPQGNAITTHSRQERPVGQALLRDDSDAQRHGVRIWAYALMDNHVHFVVAPQDEESLARCFRGAHTRFALRVNTER